jgi:hypothetical protein
MRGPHNRIETIASDHGMRIRETGANIRQCEARIVLAWQDCRRSLRLCQSPSAAWLVTFVLTQPDQIARRTNGRYFYTNV